MTTSRPSTDSTFWLPSGGYELADPPLTQRRRPSFEDDDAAAGFAMPDGRGDAIAALPPYHRSHPDKPAAFTLPRSNSHNRRHHPPSPPKTRSASADHNTSQLVEDWRAYTVKLRDRYEGERAHMAADRARAEECHIEERQLWEQERSLMKARIAELEEEIRAMRAGSIKPQLTRERLESSLAGYMPPDIVSPPAPISEASAVRSPTRFDVPQTSGRNPDGTPFYAPVSSSPKRTFTSSESSDLCLSDMPLPEGRPISFNPKPLTAADFMRSPSEELPSILETPGESIDISLIEPGLEGIHIKPSAVAPAVVARVLSPQFSPSKTSPTQVPPRPEATSPPRGDKENVQSSLDVIKHPLEHRRVMHAGHTPNHSLSVLSAPEELDPGTLTPRQISLAAVAPELQVDGAREPSDISVIEDQLQADESSSTKLPIDSKFESRMESKEDEDKPLIGPLCLMNEPAKDKSMLDEVNAKLLAEIRKSQANSPDGNGIGSAALSPRLDSEDGDDSKPLKLKPSMNFGRPMGSF